MKTVGYFDKNDKTIWSYPFLSNKKEYCSCEVAATYAGFGHVQVWMATKIFVLILHVPVVSWTRAWNRFQMQQFVHGKCTSFTTLMELLNTVIHHLWLINSAQLCNKKFQSIGLVDHVIPLCLSLMHALTGSVDPGNFRNVFIVAK